MTGNTTSCTCNAVIDLTGDSDDEQIESSRNNSGYRRRRRQTRTSDDIVVTQATIQTSCPVCVKNFTAIKTAGGYFLVTKCGHLFCMACINMLIKRNNETKRKNYIHCPTCRTRIFDGQGYQVHLWIRIINLYILTRTAPSIILFLVNKLKPY